ncbi:hypothetical protein Tco_1515816 [Tanacetum coccineum]
MASVTASMIPILLGPTPWIIAEHSSLSLTEDAAFSSFSYAKVDLSKSWLPLASPSGPSLSVSPLVKLSVVGRGGAGNGGSCVMIPDLVVMAKAGASGLGVSLLLIVESCIASVMEETFMDGDGSSHISYWYWTYSSIRFYLLFRLERSMKNWMKVVKCPWSFMGSDVL